MSIFMPDLPLIFWLPMFIMQDLCLRAYSNNAVSLKWSGIYETSVMPFLLIPIVKEFFGISTSKFAVTDKSGKVDAETAVVKNDKGENFEGVTTYMTECHHCRRL